MKRALLTSICLWSAATLGSAQADEAPVETGLLEQIAPLDAQIFEAAFLSCDEATLRTVMSPDLEFYHDLYGMIAGDLDTFLAGTLPDCVARQAGNAPYVERRLVPGSMEVRAIGEWGALQSGDHTFYGRDASGEDLFLERGTFMHVWAKTEQGWQIKRVISYDHKNE